MKYERSRKIGNKPGQEIDTSNQFDTDTNRSRREANYLMRGRTNASVMYNPNLRNDELEKSVSENRGEGMYYYEPENLNRYEMSPVTEGRQTVNIIQRSPTNRLSVIKAVKSDLNEKTDIGRNPIHTLSIQIPLKKNDQFEASPKTIYLGQENIFDLNTKTRDRRMSPNQHQGYTIDKPTDTLGPYRSDDEQKTQKVSNNIQIEMPLNTFTKSKMSPNRNIPNSENFIDGREIDEEAKKREKREKIEKLKNMQNLVYYNNDDDNIDRDSEKSNYDNIYKNYGDDIQKLSQNIPIKEQSLPERKRRKQTGFNQNKPEGKLINQNIQSMKPYADNFNDRHTVIQNMNKLSTILLSRSLEPGERSKYAKGEIEGANSFKEKDIERKTFALTKSPQNKFIRFTMAMLSTKGPNCEDRVITRVMRVDKGGVVDLAQSTHKVKKYEVKNLKKQRSPQGKNQKPRSMKDRLHAAKLVQKWWREVLSRYKKVTDRIVKLQSVWRGYWVRTYLYEIVYFSILSQAFVDKFKPPVVSNARKFIMERLSNLFADKYKNRISFEKILKLQRRTKQFLANIKDKRMKFNLRMEKIKYKVLKDAVDEIKDFAEKHNKKLKNAEDFLNKVKTIMRRKIFHQLLFAIFDLPVNQLKRMLRNKLMKNSFDRFHKNFLRKNFVKWWKNTRPKLTDAQKQSLARNLRNKILKPFFDELLRRIRKMLPKGLRERFIRRLLNRQNKIYNELVIKEYFGRWRDVARKLATLEFKNTIFESFLFRTSKGMLRRRLGKIFRLWHLKSISKLDLAKVNEFLENIKKPLRRHAYNAAKGPIDDCVNGLKLKTSKALFSFKGKFKLLTLRRYYTFWKDVLIHDKKVELQTKIYLGMKSKNFHIGLLKILAGRFQDWRRKTQMIIYLEKLNKKDHDKIKAQAANDMIEPLIRYARKKAFEAFYPKIISFLANIIKSRALKKMAKMDPKFNKLLLRRYVSLWRDVISYLRKKDFRNKLFNKLLNNASSNFRKNFLRIFLQRWNKNKAKDPLAKMAQGLGRLKNDLLKKNIRPLLDSFNDKLGELKKHLLRNSYNKGSKRWVEFRRRFITGISKNAFYRWRLKMLDLKKKDDRMLVWSKLLNSNLRKIFFRSLVNRFSFWRSNKRELKWDELEKERKKIDDAFNFIKKRNHKLNDPNFWKRLKNHKSNKHLKKFYDKILSYTELADSLKLKRFLTRWRNVCKKLTIIDLKRKLLGFVLGGRNNDNNKMDLLKALKLWQRNINLIRLERENNKNLLINKGIDHIKNLVVKRENIFINRLKKLMKLDPRGLIILTINKRLARPRIGLSRAFDRWRRIDEILRMRINERNLIDRLLFGMCKKLNSRRIRDIIKMRFLKWKKLTFEKPQDYYDKICRAVRATYSFLARKGGNEPFTLIANYKNYQKVFDKLLPAGSKLKKRLERDSLIKNWKRWRDIVQIRKNQEWACKLLKNVKDSQLKTFRANIMQKYFRKFAGYRPKSLGYPDLVKAELRIKRTLMNRDWYYIKTQMKKFGNEKCKNNAISFIFGQNKSLMKKKLRRCLLLWHKIMLKDDSNIKSKVLRSLKRIFIEKYFSTPLENGFRRWLRAMIEKPKDIKPIIIGSSLLTNFLRKKFNPLLFKKIMDYRSPNHLQRTLLDKILPKSKFAIKRQLRNRLLKWRDIVNKMNVLDLKTKTLNFMYGRNRSKVMHLFLNRYFKRFKNNTLRKPIDYSKINDGEKIYFRVMVNKFLKGFITPSLKDYSYFKFLRAIFKGSSKFQQRAAKPFLERWRSITNKLKILTVKHSLWSRVVGRMTSEKTKKFIESHLRAKLRLWKLKKNEMKQKEIDAIQQLVDKIKNGVLKIHLPDLLDRLKKIAYNKKVRGKLSKTKRICDNLWNIILKRKLDLWDKNVRKLQLKDLRIKIMQANMRLLRNKFNLGLLSKAFQKMKPPKEVMQKNYSPLTVAMITTKRLLNRRPWKDFKERTSMMNIKAPYGMKLSQVLMRHGKNAGKVMIIRNMNMRPYWRNWKLIVKELEEKDLQEKLMKKVLFRNADKNHRLILRNYIRLWMDKKVQLELKEMRDNTVGRLYATIYGNNMKLLLRRLLKHWKAINDDHFDKLNKITLSSTKLINYYKRKYLNDLYRRVKNKKDILSKKERAKEIWLQYIKKLDKAKVFLAYYLWKKQLFAYKILRLKYNILKNIVNQCDRDKTKENYNKKKEYFLKWRIQSFPKNLYQILENIRKGENILMRNLRNRFNRDIFDKINHKAIKHRIRERLFKWLAKFDDQAKKELMRIKFRLWKIRLNDKKIMQDRLRQLFEKYLQSNHGVHELLEKPLNDFKRQIQKIHSAKHNSVNIIQRFFRNLFEEEKVTKSESKNNCLKSSFHKADKKQLKQVQKYIKLWKKNCGLSKTEDAGKLIQNFLRGGVKNRDKAANKVNNLVDKLTKAVKRVEFNKIKERAKKNRLKQLMLRCIKDIPDELRKEIFKKYFYRWWKHQIKKKAQDAGFLLTTISRGFLARKFAKKQLKKKYKIYDIIQKLFGKHLNLLMLNFNRWKLITRIIKMSNAAKVIQNYLANRISEVKKKEEMRKLRIKFVNYFKHQVADIMKKAGKINKDNANILYNTLRTIYYERPFDLLKKSLDFLGKLKKLKQIYPIIQEKFKLYWLPYYLKMWKTKTWDEKIRRIIQIQNWVRARIVLWRIRALLRKQNLLSKYAAKMTNDNKLILRIFLKNWLNRARSQGLTKAATNLQKMWQGNTSRKNLDREVSKIKLRNLFRKLFIRMINTDLVKMSDLNEPLNHVLSKVLNGAIENRYTTNNLLDLARNAIRNNFLFNLTKRKEYNDYLTSLRRYWELWHKNLVDTKKTAIDLQKNYRKYLAQKDLKKRLRLKDALYNLMLKNSNSLHGKLKICFDTWRNKANLLNLNQNAKVIQDYVKKRNERWRWTRIIIFFKDLAFKKLPFEILNMAKVHKLKETLLKIYLKKFYDHIKLKEKMRKLTWFFVKHFSAEDDKFKKLFLQRYYIEWWERAKKLKALRNRSAQMIQNNFRRYLMEKFLRKEREKKNRVLRILDKLTNDNQLRLRIRLHLWKGLVNNDKLKNSAKVINNFFEDFKNKSRRKKNKKRLDEIKEGLENIKIPIIKGASRYPLEKIKDAAGRDKLRKLVLLLQKKRKDHLETAMNSIKDFDEEIKKIRESHAKRIQRKWKQALVKRGIWGLILKFKKMRFILNLMKDRDFRHLNKSFKWWRHNAIGNLLTQSAKTIQDFCNERIIKYRKRKEQDIKDKYKRLAEGLEKKFCRIPAVKLIKYWLRIPTAIFNLRKYIFNKFKYNVDNYEKLKYMWKLFRIPKSCSIKMLRKAFLKWWDINDKIKKNDAANLITRNLRNTKRKNKEKKIIDTLSKRLLNLALKHSDLKRFFFMKWYGNALQNKTNDAAKKINDFVSLHWERIKNKKKWKYLIDALHDKNYLKDGLGLLRRYKVWKSLSILFKFCDHKIKRDGYDELKKRVKDNSIMNLLKAVLGNYRNRGNILLLNHFWKLWKVKVHKLQERDNTVKKFGLDLEVLFRIHAAKFYGDAAICKRLKELFDTVDKVKAMKKLKEKSHFVQKMRNLKNLINKGDNNLADDNKKGIADNLYKIYTYRILQKLTGAIKKCQNNTILPHYAKDLLNNLNDILHHDSKYNYQDKLRSEARTKPKQFTFSANTKSLHKRKIEEAKDHDDHNDMLPYLTPFLIGFLERLFRERKIWAMERLKLVWKGHNLSNKMLIFLRLLMSEKRRFMDNLHNLSLYNQERPIMINKLREFLKRLILKKIRDNLSPSARYIRLVYLCRLTFMHSDIADRRFSKEIVKRWKFLVHMQRLARRKMESMYKNFHIQYLAAAQDIFGDEENNAGMVSEFSALSEKFGMFKYESSESLEGYRKNFVKSSTVRKYNFGPVEFAIFDDDENPINENDMYANKTNKTLRSASNYEILDGELDESFIQGREDNTMNRKK